MFAPVIVIQNTTVSSAIINGKPHMRLVTIRSSVRSRSKRARLAGPRHGAIGDARGVGVNRFGQLIVKVADFPAQRLRRGQDVVGGSGSIGRG